MRKCIFAALAPIFTLTLSATALAQENKDDWYEVEVIIFENLAADTVREEHWPKDPGWPDTSQAIELDTAIKPPTGRPGEKVQLVDINQMDPSESHYMIPYEEYQLQKEYKKLVESEKYLPLVHVAWRQMVPNRNKPDLIHIHSDLKTPLASEAPMDEVPEAPISDTLALPPAPVFAENAAKGGQPRLLDGMLSIGRARYLHVNTDLILYKPVIETSQEQAPSDIDVINLEDIGETTTFTQQRVLPEYFRVEDSMRMRSGELHYLDHPMVGMLILFTPYKLPEPEEEVEATPPATPTPRPVPSKLR